MPAIRTIAERAAAYPRLGSLALGAIAACGFQPLSLWPLTLIAVAGFIEFVARAPNWRQAFLIGWLFGLAHFTVGNNWIATAFTYQAAMPAWLGSIAVVLLSIYLAVFPALAALGAWLFAARLGRREGGRAQRALPWIGLVFIPFWIITEWMRAWVFTGFAWNPLGIVLLGSYETQGLALLAPWLGTYGLSGLAVGLAAALRRLVRLGSKTRGQQRMALAIGSITIAALIAAVMSAPAAYLERAEGVRPYTLVQPDIRQERLNDPRFYEANFRKTAQLTLPFRPGERRLVLWPESGLLDYVREGYPQRYYTGLTYGGDPVMARERIGSIIGPYALLLTGAVDLVIENGRAIAARNSVTAIDYRGHILAGYSKAHLVPYGEYLPMRALLEPLGLTRLVSGALEFVPGPGPRTFNFGEWGRAGIQICYEIVFSGQVVDSLSRPDYIFNPSNDGWFGSWGPPQHLAQARLRAIEEGLPVLRSTTTGISAVIDADGIVREHIPSHVSGRIDGMIPPPHTPTLFSRFGNAVPLILAAMLLAVSAVALRRANR